MKKLFFFLSVFIMVYGSSCNNTPGSNSNNARTRTKNKADSLMDDIMADHGTGMAKLNKVSAAQGLVQHIIDSIGKLPEKERKLLSAPINDLDSLLTQLRSAENGMNLWMDAFNMDSLANKPDERIQYLESERKKTAKIKEELISSLQKADSLLKKYRR